MSLAKEKMNLIDLLIKEINIYEEQDFGCCCEAFNAGLFQAVAILEKEKERIKAEQTCHNKEVVIDGKTYILTLKE